MWREAAASQNLGRKERWGRGEQGDSGGEVRKEMLEDRPPMTVRTLYVVGGVRDRGRRQVPGVPSSLDVPGRLPGQPQTGHKLLPLPAPVQALGSLAPPRPLSSSPALEGLRLCARHPRPSHVKHPPALHRQFVADLAVLHDPLRVKAAAARGALLQPWLGSELA